MLRPTAALAAALLVLGASACNDDGRTLAPAPPVAASPSTTTTAPEVRQLTLTSPAFADGDSLDAAFTCDGVDVPPPLEITGVPDVAAELAVVVTDTTAGGYVHWVLTGLPVDLTRLESGVIPPQGRVARSSGGVDGWEGPCPPPGEPPHAYQFTVHVLAEPIGLAPGVGGREAIQLLEQASVQSDSIVGFYERAG